MSPPTDHPPIPERKIGVLLINLGTPDGTTYAPMRRYLKEFLSDRRVIETPRVLWWPLLNLVILSTRPGRKGRFVDLDDRAIELAFKLYPWEWIAREQFGMVRPGEILYAFRNVCLGRSDGLLGFLGGCAGIKAHDFCRVGRVDVFYAVRANPFPIDEVLVQFSHFMCLSSGISRGDRPWPGRAANGWRHRSRADIWWRGSLC